MTTATSTLAAASAAMFPHQPPPIHDKKYDPILGCGPLALKRGFGAAADRYLLLVAPQSVIDVETVFAELYDKPAWALANGNPSSNEDGMIKALGQITKSAVEESPMLILMPTQYRAESAEFIHMSDVIGISDEEDLRSPCHFTVHIAKGGRLRFSAATSVAYRYWMKALLPALKQGSDARTKRVEKSRTSQTASAVQQNQESWVVDGVYRDMATARWVAEQPNVDYRTDSPRSPPPPTPTSSLPPLSASPMPMSASSPMPESHRSTPMGFVAGYYVPADPAQIQYYGYYPYPGHPPSSPTPPIPQSQQSQQKARPVSYVSPLTAPSTASAVTTPAPLLSAGVSLDSRSMSRYSYTDSVNWVSPRSSIDPSSNHSYHSLDMKSGRSASWYGPSDPAHGHHTSTDPSTTHAPYYPYGYPAYTYPTPPPPSIPYHPPSSISSKSEESKRASTISTVQTENPEKEYEDSVSAIPDLTFDERDGLELAVTNPSKENEGITAVITRTVVEEEPVSRPASVITAIEIQSRPGSEHLAPSESQAVEGKGRNDISSSTPSSPESLGWKTPSGNVGSFLSSMVKRFSRADSGFEGSKVSSISSPRH
ncbi:hypothetical protein HDU67_005545 [Dinochytrium kinnereticum]|nr:hypothetical protein HDU67_005545 [Dinochytrium kinnereticum]